MGGNGRRPGTGGEYLAVAAAVQFTAPPPGTRIKGGNAFANSVSPRARVQTSSRAAFLRLLRSLNDNSCVDNMTGSATLRIVLPIAFRNGLLNALTLRLACAAVRTSGDTTK